MKMSIAERNGSANTKKQKTKPSSLNDNQLARRIRTKRISFRTVVDRFAHCAARRGAQGSQNRGTGRGVRATKPGFRLGGRNEQEVGRSEAGKKTKKRKTKPISQCAAMRSKNGRSHLPLTRPFGAPSPRGRGGSLSRQVTTPPQAASTLDATYTLSQRARGERRCRGNRSRKGLEVRLYLRPS